MPTADARPTSPQPRRGAGLTAAAATLAAVAALRRAAHRTGVTDAEAYGPLPGDTVISHPMLEWTRGQTIASEPERVWPWVAQMGYGRAGWYTPERLDRWANRWLWRLEDKHPFQPSPGGSCPSSSTYGPVT